MGLSCLLNSKAPLVCDASTVINLNATGFASSIIRALPNPFIISEVVLAELQEDIRSGRNDAKLVADLQSQGLITLVPLDDVSSHHFEALVAGRTADTLDDGEAATIATALAIQGTAIIDERKANRICKERYPHLIAGCTVDIFAHDALSALGAGNLSIAVLNALQQARMRVLPHHLQWVTEVIGPVNLETCPSLPTHIRTKRRI